MLLLVINAFETISLLLVQCALENDLGGILKKSLTSPTGYNGDRQHIVCYCQLQNMVLGHSTNSYMSHRLQVKIFWLCIHLHWTIEN